MARRRGAGADAPLRVAGRAAFTNGQAGQRRRDARAHDDAHRPHAGATSTGYLVTGWSTGRRPGRHPRRCARAAPVAAWLRDAGVQEGPELRQRYTNQFEVIPLGGVASPRRVPRPLVQAHQTARVVGPRRGGEIPHRPTFARAGEGAVPLGPGGERRRAGSCWSQGCSRTGRGPGGGSSSSRGWGWRVVVGFLEETPTGPRDHGVRVTTGRIIPNDLPISKRAVVQFVTTPASSGNSKIAFEDLNIAQGGSHLHAKDHSERVGRPTYLRWQ